MLLLLGCVAVALQRVAVVTGASRGIGRGIAVELGRQGFAVFVLGRSSRAGHLTTERAVAAGSDLTVESAAEEVDHAGGVGIPVQCDVGQDGEVERVLQQVRSEHGRLDVLVCSAYTTPPGRLRDDFWKQGMDVWDACNGVGLRSVYAACSSAAPLMIETAAAAGSVRPPLMVLVSSFGGRAYTFNVAYGVGKCAVDRLAADMSYQLRKHGVATTSLYPGVVRTEANLQLEADGSWAEASGGLDLATGETPTFSGRAVAALAELETDAMMERSGRAPPPSLALHAAFRRCTQLRRYYFCHIHIHIYPYP